MDITNKRSIVYILIAYLFLAFLGAASKYFNFIPELTLAFSKTLMLLGLIPILFSNQRRELKTSMLPFHLLLALSYVGAFYLFFHSLHFLPLTLVVLLFSTSALFIPTISLFIAEKKLKTLNGFFLATIGVIILLQPSYDLFQVAILFALLSGVLMSASIILYKQLHMVEPYFRINFYLILFGFIFGMLPILFRTKLILSTDLDWSYVLQGFFAIGLLSWVFHVLRGKVITFERKVFVEVFAYFGVLIAILLDFFIWQTLPQYTLFLGSALIIIGSLYTTVIHKKRGLS